MEDIKFYAPLVRVYFNKQGDPEKLWSIDFGSGTQEILCGALIMTARGISKIDPDADVKAWVEYSCVSVCLTPGNCIYLDMCLSADKKAIDDYNNVALKVRRKK